MGHEHGGPAADAGSPSLSVALRVIANVIARASEAGNTVAVAVADRTGDLVAFSRMDGGERRWTRQAQRKAYTSAVMGRTTTSLGDNLRTRAISIVEYGDLHLTTLPGGAPLLAAPGRAIAGIGVAGDGGAEWEDELAAVGAKMLGEQSG
jgi:Uncharacterized protein, possibly involved in utilization of glycolate and propanediol